MKLKWSYLVLIALFSALFAGCATRNTSSGGRESSLLGGAVTVATDSFQPVNPATINVDTSKLAGSGGPSGKKVTVLWGLFTFHGH
jgi:hypothetical protein